MSDLAKWAILFAGLVAVIAIVVSLPIANTAFDFAPLSAGIKTILNYLSEAFVFGRGLLNNLISPWARDVLSGLLFWIFFKWVATWTIKIGVWIYHYFFR